MMWDMFGGADAPEQTQQRSRDLPSGGSSYGSTPAFPMPMPGAGYDPVTPSPFMVAGGPPPGPQIGPSIRSYTPSYSPWGFDGSAPPPPPSSAPPVFAGGQRSAVAIDYQYSGKSSHTHTSHVAHTTTHAPAHTASALQQTQHKLMHSSSSQVIPPVSHAGHNHVSHFQYSNCTGKRKAVCIGINYYRQPFELFGCVNDAKNVYRFLNQSHHYREEDIVLLVDDTRNPRQLPTRQNILEAMRWLVRDAHPNDSLFFHYSGHGGQVKDQDGDEVDGWDEVIYPMDYQKTGSIVDDLMHTIMVKPLPTGCRLTALFDSCHSGSILDLPYLYHTNGRAKGSQVKARHIKEKSTPADVISWSGCKDSQKSADTFEDGAAAGAMSYAFMTSLRHNPHQTYQELLRSVREILKKKYSQKPQLSSAHRIDTTLQFII